MSEWTLHTDLYQINMMKAYWNDGVQDKKTRFDIYFRNLPFGNGYAVFAGLERAIEYLQQLTFDEEDLNDLEQMGYEQEFLDYLRSFEFKGNVRSVKEGEVVFANEPLMTIEAGIAEAQLVESALLNIVNYHTLIATKASRIRQVVGEEGKLFEFGLRRGQEKDATQWGTRAAYVGGFDGTSNVKAGRMFGLPVVGTHAHAFVQFYNDDVEAFRKYAEAHTDCVFLVDTFDTLKSGVPAAIQVAKEFGDKINFKGIRLDSGDMAYLSKEARKMLDEAGFEDTRIVASNDLDETTIFNLKAQGAKIDDWGVGTKIITAFDQPALGAVDKLVAVFEEEEWKSDRIKISSSPNKTTTPGRKTVYRIINKENGKSEGDYIALEEEVVKGQEKLKMFDPVHTYLSKFVTNFEAVELLEDVFVEGEFVGREVSVEDMKSYHKEQLDVLWEEYKRTLNPEFYPVDLSELCWENKTETIKKKKESVK